MSSLGRVKHIIVVLSGKGGVGKSSVATQLAFSLCLAGRSVTILDIDLTGPSIPRMLGIEDAKVVQAPGGWLPVPVHPASSRTSSAATSTTGDGGGGRGAIGRLSAMSLGFLLPSRGDAVVWRGPKKTAMVRQFLSDVLWEEDTDFLVVDTPPGTGDEQISLAETLHRLARPGQLAGAVVVTTPQQVAVADVRKELNFCAKTNLPVLGVVENMSGYQCEFCPGCWDPFNSDLDDDGNIRQGRAGREGGGRSMAREFAVPYLGEVPLDPQLVMLFETGRTPVRREWTAGAAGAAGAAGGAWVEVAVPGEEPRGLAEKYARCSLADRFGEIRDELLRKIEGEVVTAD